MKDNRFIELVNLYIDRQINGEEMAALEAEMQANPRRRAVYRQYCQMHRATTLVYESFRTETADQPAEIVASNEKVARFETQNVRRRTPWAYYVTGLAAACVALVFARVGSSNKASAQNSENVALKAEPSVTTVAMVQPVSAAVASPAAEVSRAKAVNLRTTLVVEQDYAAMLAAMRREEQRAFASGQIQPRRSSSLFEDGVFDSQAAGSTNTFRTKQTSNQQPEFAAFQFQR